MAVVSEIRDLRNLTEISLDGTVWMRVRRKDLGKLPLEVGDPVDPEAFTDRLAALQAADCYEAALTLLDSAARTRNDMKRQLMRRGFVEAAAEATAARLTENGLIDDERYAQRMAESQLNKSIGIYSVRRKLQAKQLSEADIDAAMACFDDEQQSAACRAAAEKLFRKYAALPPREARAKLSQALGRRGFGWDVINETVGAILDESDIYD